MLKQSNYVFLLGSFLYLVAWLFVLPAIAEFSTVVAILSLSFLTALYCVVVARMKGRNEVLWGILGAAGGFLEIGIIPVLVISLVSTRLALAEK